MKTFIHAAERAVRPRLGVLSLALVRRRAHAWLGFRTLGDYAREGRAPEAIVFSLGLRPGGGALLRARSGDVLLS